MNDQEMKNHQEVAHAEMRAHHELGPSNYSMWLECPCFVSREGEGGAFTVRGTYAHKVVHALLTGEEHIPPKEGAEVELVQADDVQCAEWFAEEVRKRAYELKWIYTEDRESVPSSFTDVPEMVGVFGTVDAWHADEFGELHVYDFKTFDRGEKDHTPQMEGYAILIVANHPYFKEKPIHLHVGAGGIRQIVSYVTTYENACAHVSSILKRHLEANKEPMPCSACQYCAHASSCEGVDHCVQVAREIVMDALPAPVEADAHEVKLPRWADLSLPVKMVVIGALEKAFKQTKAEFNAQLEHEGFVEDTTYGVRFERKEKKPNRECTSLVELAGALEGHGITNDAFINDLCKISRTGVVEALMDANEGMKKSQADAILDPFWRIPDGAKVSYVAKRVS